MRASYNEGSLMENHSEYPGFATGSLNVQIQTTSVCTGKCIICPYLESWHKHNPGVMSDNIFHSILEQLSSFPVRKICPYLENEPLADPQIFQRIAKIRAAFPSALIEVSTNALALTRENVDKLIAALAGGPHEIWISFHGVDERSFEGIMGIPFSVCLNNIIHLLKVAQSVPLSIKIRGAGLGRVAALKHDFSFSEHTYLTFWEKVFADNGITNRPQVQFFTYHDRAGTISRNAIRLEKPVRPDLTGFTCTRLTDWLHFLYTGELILCCMDYHRETVFGDLRTQSLGEILQGSTASTLAQKICGRLESSPNFICKRCLSPGG